MWSRQFWRERQQKPRAGHSFSSIQSTGAQHSKMGAAALACNSCTSLAQDKAAVSRVHASPLHLLGFWDRGSRKVSKERATEWHARVWVKSQQSPPVLNEEENYFICCTQQLEELPTLLCGRAMAMCGSATGGYPRGESEGNPSSDWTPSQQLLLWFHELIWAGTHCWELLNEAKPFP